MEARKMQEKAMEKMEVAKEVIVEKAEELASDVRVRSHKVGHKIHEKVTHPYDTIDETRAGLDSMFSAQRMDRAKDKIETEASIMVGYKDQFLGAIKEAFGHMFKDEKLKAHGHQQRIKGQTEVKLQKALEEERKFQRVRAQIVEVLMRREALLSELVRSGGFEVYRQNMRHVELKEEPSVGLLFAAPGVGRTSFTLKRYNVQPLLSEIRERRTMKPMVFVQVREKGLLRSIPLTRKDIKGFKGRSDRYLDLFAAIRRSGTYKLHPVPSAKIHDRSAPRLDLFRTIAAADEHRSELMRDIVSQTGRSHLIHVAGAESFATKGDNGAGVAPKSARGQKAQLLDELRQADVDLKHVETVDKSQPTIGKDVQLKTWDKKGFLDEVRQGTELKHI